MTKDEFLNKVSAEGGFEGAASYLGIREIKGESELTAAWSAFVTALNDLDDIYEDWCDANTDTSDW